MYTVVTHKPDSGAGCKIRGWVHTRGTEGAPYVPESSNHSGVTASSV